MVMRICRGSLRTCGVIRLAPQYDRVDAVTRDVRGLLTRRPDECPVNHFMNSIQPAHKRRLMAMVRAAIAIIVATFVIRAVMRGREQLAAEEFSLWEVDVRWLLVAAFLYVVGLLPMGIYWHRMLHVFGQSPSLLDTMTAYYVGHLGKYVPGKAMVVVIRSTLIDNAKANTTITAISVFAETLTMMAVGAFMAAGIIAWSFSQYTWLLVVSIGLMLTAGIPTWPPIFRWIVRRLKIVKFEPDVERALSAFTVRLMGFGWMANMVGWIFLGLSLWAILKAIPMQPPLDSPLALLPRTTASVCLAVVAGFLSLIPGGLGVRELVLDELMAEPFGPTVAIVSAVLLRLVWLMTELAISGILYLWMKGRRVAVLDSMRR